MIIARLEFLQRARLDGATLDAWIEEEWLIPAQQEPEPTFSDMDLARVRLIRDLTEDMGVNGAGVGVILNLVDQVHGLRKALADVLGSARARPGAAKAKPD